MSRELVAFLAARFAEDAAWARDARAVEEVRAKRGILDLLTYSSGGITEPTGPEQEAVLRYLALPYAGHPDWRDEWRP